MSFEPSVKRYSAIAQAWLVVNGVEHPLSQLAPEFVILQRQSSIPSGEAILILTIDGREERRMVHVAGPDASYPHRLRISRGKPANA